MNKQKKDKSTQNPKPVIPKETIAAVAADEKFGAKHASGCRPQKRHRAGWWCWLEEELEALKKGREESKMISEICKEFQVKDEEGKVLFTRHHSAACLKIAMEKGW